MGFDRKLPEELGVSSRGIIRFMDRLEREKIHIHSFRLYRRGVQIAETFYAPFSGSNRHMLFSMSKSFTSTAMGFAVQDGLLSVDDKVISFFPEELPSLPCENMCRMTVKHLLTMNTGHTTEPAIFEERPGADWAANFLHSYVEKEPGTHFMYNTAATYMISAIVQKVTGKTVLDYLKEKLFDAAEMSPDLWWEESPQGIDAGGYGLNARLDDLAKLGHFLLNKGKVGDRQLLDPKWIEDAQYPWSDNSAWPGTADWNQGYGYQFWMCVPDHIYRGDGAFGQYTVVMPDQEMVFVSNSGTADMGNILTALWEEVLPGVDNVPGDLQAVSADQNELAEKLGSRVMRSMLEDSGRQILAPAVPERNLGSYVLSTNALSVQKIEFRKDPLEMVLTIDGKESRVPLSEGTWQPVRFEISDPMVTKTRHWSHYAGLYEKAAVKSAVSDGKLVVDLAFTETPFETELTVSFLENGIEVRAERNVQLAKSGCVMMGVRE